MRAIDRCKAGEDSALIPENVPEESPGSPEREAMIIAHQKRLVHAGAVGPEPYDKWTPRKGRSFKRPRIGRVVVSDRGQIFADVKAAAESIHRTTELIYRNISGRIANAAGIRFFYLGSAPACIIAKLKPAEQA